MWFNPWHCHALKENSQVLQKTTASQTACRAFQPCLNSPTLTHLIVFTTECTQFHLAVFISIIGVKNYFRCICVNDMFLFWCKKKILSLHFQLVLFGVDCPCSGVHVPSQRAQENIELISRRWGIVALNADLFESKIFYSRISFKN